jgi:hypothetical protein
MKWPGCLNANGAITAKPGLSISAGRKRLNLEGG